MAAAACETWRDQFGVYRSNCRFSGDLRRVEDMEVTFLKYRGQYTIRLPDLVNDFDIIAAGVVDPASTAHPSGTQFESDESDNALMHACRVYGTNPVLIPTPPPVCN